MNVLLLIVGFLVSLSSSLYSMEEYSLFHLQGRDGAKVSMLIYDKSDSQTMQVAYNEYQGGLRSIEHQKIAHRGETFKVVLYHSSNHKYLDTDQEGLDDVAQWFKLYDNARKQENKKIIITDVSDDRLVKLINNISPFYENNIPLFFHDDTIVKAFLSDVYRRIQSEKIDPRLLPLKVREALGLKDTFQISNESSQEKESLEKNIVEKITEQEIKPQKWSLRDVAQKYSHYFIGGAFIVAALVAWKLNIIKKVGC